MKRRFSLTNANTRGTGEEQQLNINKYGFLVQMYCRSNMCIDLSRSSKCMLMRMICTDMTKAAKLHLNYGILFFPYSWVSSTEMKITVDGIHSW